MRNQSSAAGIQYLDYLQLGVMVVDAQFNVICWNRWLESHSNVMAEDVLNKPFAEVFPDLANSRLADVIQQALEERMSGFISAPLNQSLLPLYPSINHQLKQMDLMRQTMQVSPIVDENNHHFALIQITDMTNALAKGMQLRTQTQEIKQLMRKDELTMVANRQKFDERLNEEFRRAQRAKSSLVIGLVDIDYFKLFNNHYGRETGDACLAKIGSAFDHSFSRSTDMVARYSGQVFAIILPSTSFDGGKKMSETIKNIVRNLKITSDVSTASAYVTVSIGMAHIEPVLEDALDAFVEAAQFALDQVKLAGGDKAMIYEMRDGKLYSTDGNDNIRLLLQA